jgi:predicted RecB family nuclease
MKITPSILYNYLTCPHKVWRDVYGPKEEQAAEENPFVKLLWERGVQHEENIVKKLSSDILDLSGVEFPIRIELTNKAIADKTPLIYQGVLQTEDLYGIPDILKLHENGTYFPIDIKSGKGFEGSESLEDEATLKKHYAVQLCLYVEILEAMNISSGRHGLIIDGSGQTVVYDLNTSIGKKSTMTHWQFYQQLKSNVGRLLNNQIQNTPALAGCCKLCTWHTSCKNWCVETGDLTQIFYVGRSLRDKLKQDLNVSTISELLSLDVTKALEHKKKDKGFLAGIGESTLSSSIRRGKLFFEKLKPAVYEKVVFPKAKYELFFDIEDDPTQDRVYLHGVYERTDIGQKFIPFLSLDASQGGERKAWSDFWAYIWSLPKDDFAVYYYSSHEKTTYKDLQKKYPEIISEKEVADFFDDPKVIDLYQIVLKNTDWPVGSYSIKELANYCGFKWRDVSPSGALSIQWYNEYLKTGNSDVLNRILEYNEDDCRATMVLKDRLDDMFRST